MATDNAVSLSDRVTASFLQLSETAKRLNAASQELSVAIAPIEAALKDLNIGVVVWYKFAGQSSQDGSYWGRCIGYAKIKRKWGLSLSIFAGHDALDRDDEEEWLFNEAPRALRIEAIQHLPALLDELVKQAATTVSELADATKQTRDLAQTITAAAKAKK